MGFEEREVRCWVSSLRASGIVLVRSLKRGVFVNKARSRQIRMIATNLILNDWPQSKGVHSK